MSKIAILGYFIVLLGQFTRIFLSIPLKFFPNHTTFFPISRLFMVDKINCYYYACTKKIYQSNSLYP